jgi:hypothetical protein
MNTTTLSVRTSLIAAVHAEPWMPEATTYVDRTTAPIHTAAVDEIEPDEVCETMIPSPFSCSARYGIIAATATIETNDAERARVVLRDEEVGLREQPPRRGVAPDRRQQPVRQDVGERPVAEDVVRRPARAVDEPGPAEERERRVDLARHQQEDEDRAEPAAARGPLLEVHVAPAAGAQREPDRQDEERTDDEECDVHRRSPRSRARSRVSSR